MVEVQSETLGLARLLAHSGAGDAPILRTDGASGESACRRDVDHLARRIAGGLLAREKRGTRILVALPPGPEYFAAFFACIYSRMIPVPVPLPRGARRLARTAQIVAACQASRLICAAEAGVTGAELGLRFDPLDDLADHAAVDPLRVAGEDVAYLQFTSGSTAAPRGVVISHRAVLANLQAFDDAVGRPRDSWVVSWLPLHHDMGLVTALFALHCGLGLALSSPEQFATRPWSWIEALSRYRACFSGAPNFAYDLLTRAAAPEGGDTIDLSGWHTAYCGAEPIKPHVLRRFARRFAAYGFAESSIKPGYGMAEFTLLASIARPGRMAPLSKVIATDSAGRPLELSECGTITSGHRLEIVDPETRRSLAPGSTGEIWLDGPSKGSGYWGLPDQSEATFRAHIDGCDGEYLRTGDLGFVDGDTLYVTGRLKDLVIVRGCNFHPQEIEDVVLCAHPALRGLAAAFTVEGGAGEGLGVACELRRSARSQQHVEIISAIQSELASSLGVHAEMIALLRAGSAPRTTSGKIRRRTCSDLLASGTLKPAARWHSGAAAGVADDLRRGLPDDVRIRAWIVRWLSDRLGIDAAKMSDDQPLQSLGLDSIGSVELAFALEDWLHLRLDETILWRTPTLSTLSRELSRLLDQSACGDAAAPAADEPPLPVVEAIVRRVEGLGDAEVENQFETRIRSRA